MHLNFTFQFNFGDAAQVFAQDFFFDLELVRVAGVLVVTSAALAEVGARRLGAVRRGLYDCSGAGAGEAGLFFDDRRFDFLCGKNEGNEDCFATSAVLVAGRSGGKACESVAAVDKLFNLQEQELILRHGQRQKARGKPWAGIAVENNCELTAPAAKCAHRAWE
jgi:hypothetical protein